MKKREGKKVENCSKSGVKCPKMLKCRSYVCWGENGCQSGDGVMSKCTEYIPLYEPGNCPLRLAGQPAANGPAYRGVPAPPGRRPRSASAAPRSEACPGNTSSRRRRWTNYIKDSYDCQVTSNCDFPLIKAFFFLFKRNLISTLYKMYKKS